MEFLLCAENQLVLICRLWFDVGIKRYTTTAANSKRFIMLWFDVGIKRYTTSRARKRMFPPLWFDVGIKRYTTRLFLPLC